MREFQRKRVLHKFLYSSAVLFALLIALALLIKSSWGVYVKERAIRENLNRAQEEVTALTARRASLEEKIKLLQTPEGIEAEIREQFQMAKPGEKMVLVVEERDIAEDISKPAQSFISRFFDLFR